jgi:hypothetical protein
MGFLVDKLTLDHAFLQDFSYSPSGTISPMLYIHISISHCWYTKAHQWSHCLSTHSLSHIAYKQNNIVTNMKCLILHINNSLHHKWLSFNSRQTADDIKATLWNPSSHKTVHTTHCFTCTADKHTNSEPHTVPSMQYMYETANCACLCSLTTTTDILIVHELRMVKLGEEKPNL